jgi:hypothetical protein
MTQRLPCLSAPGTLADYAAYLDDPFTTPAQRRSFRAYLQ